ncbi:MAG: hypothetical protein Q4E28_01070 [Clostridia bacterium]|nr:hypothetical protein [Clostridia bacterium]
MKKIIEYAKEHGYETAEYQGVFKDSNVYIAVYNYDETNENLVGLPAFIFEKNDKLEWVQDGRSLEVLNHFYED